MNKAPWLTNEKLNLIALILTSYEITFQESLLKSLRNCTSNKEKGVTLFTSKNPILAHDNADDPALNYANAAALQLWDSQWDEMIGMPSRLTAPSQERRQRLVVLNNAKEQKGIKNYQGIRINRKGQLFMIKNARIWTIWNERGIACGQAATFDNWWKIEKITHHK